MMSETAKALIIRNICKNFGSVCAVKNMTLEVQDGEFISLLGPSGCGKTTLLRIIAGFETPDFGEVIIGGSNILELPPNKRPMNMVFQRYALFPHMTVYENVAFSQFLLKKPKSEINQRVKKMLELVQLEGFESRKPDQLSGGQCQRIALARALINEPSVLLLDEPLGALDLKIRKQMQIELKKIQEKLGITFIYVTHDQEEALVMSDRIVLMQAGESIQVDTPKRIYNRPNSKFSATFIGESNLFEGAVAAVHGDHIEVLVSGVAVLAGKTEGVARGDGVSLAVRLERVKRADRGQKKDFENLLTGTVEDVVFFGFVVKYYVRVNDELLIIAEEEIAKDEQEEDTPIGGKVTVGFSIKDVNLFVERVHSDTL
jgi:spermidine/putrescine transport system ATP-binding protein